MRKIAQEQLKNYEKDIKKTQKIQEDFIAQKEEELRKVNTEIERARYVKQTQISNAITKVLIYISVFL